MRGDGEQWSRGEVTIPPGYPHLLLAGSPRGPPSPGHRRDKGCLFWILILPARSSGHPPEGSLSCYLSCIPPRRAHSGNTEQLPLRWGRGISLSVPCSDLCCQARPRNLICTGDPPPPTKPPAQDPGTVQPHPLLALPAQLPKRLNTSSPKSGSPS